MRIRRDLGARASGLLLAACVRLRRDFRPAVLRPPALHEEAFTAPKARTRSGRLGRMQRSGGARDHPNSRTKLLHQLWAAPQTRPAASNTVVPFVRLYRTAGLQHLVRDETLRDGAGDWPAVPPPPLPLHRGFTCRLRHAMERWPQADGAAEEKNLAVLAQWTTPRRPVDGPNPRRREARLIWLTPASRRAGGRALPDDGGAIAVMGELSYGRPHLLRRQAVAEWRTLS